MPKVELEIGEDGSVGTLPEPLQKFFDAKFGEAFGKGKAKAAEEMRSHLPDPVERERLKAAELENSRLREAEALREKNYQEAERIRNDRHAAELKERDEKLTVAQTAIAARTARVRELVQGQIREIAIRQGAREASLDELATLLGSRIGLDDALQVFVTDTKDAGKPALDADGKTPLTVEGLVSHYLADHPHHKAAPAGRGGNAPGGRSLQGASGLDAEKDALLEEVAKNPTITNVARAFGQAGKARSA